MFFVCSFCAVLLLLNSFFNCIVAQNELKQSGPAAKFSLKCPDGSYVSAISSTYTDSGEDRRIYRLTCSKVSAQGSTTCKTGDETTLLKDFVSGCSGNEYLAGLESEFKSQDRKFRTICCKTTGLSVTFTACTDIKTSANAGFNVFVPKDQIIQKVSSQYVLSKQQNGKFISDRSFAFTVCPTSAGSQSNVNNILPPPNSIIAQPAKDPKIPDSGPSVQLPPRKNAALAGTNSGNPNPSSSSNSASPSNPSSSNSASPSNPSSSSKSAGSSNPSISSNSPSPSNPSSSNTANPSPPVQNNPPSPAASQSNPSKSFATGPQLKSRPNLAVGSNGGNGNNNGNGNGGSGNSGNGNNGNGNGNGGNGNNGNGGNGNSGNGNGNGGNGNGGNSNNGNGNGNGGNGNNGNGNGNGGNGNSGNGNNGNGNGNGGNGNIAKPSSSGNAQPAQFQIPTRRPSNSNPPSAPSSGPAPAPTNTKSQKTAINIAKGNLKKNGADAGDGGLGSSEPGWLPETVAFRSFDTKCPTGSAVRQMKIKRVEKGVRRDAIFALKCEPLPSYIDTNDIDDQVLGYTAVKDGSVQSPCELVNGQFLCGLRGEFDENRGVEAHCCRVKDTFPSFRENPQTVVPTEKGGIMKADASKGEFIGNVDQLPDGTFVGQLIAFGKIIPVTGSKVNTVDGCRCKCNCVCPKKRQKRETSSNNNDLSSFTYQLLNERHKRQEDCAGDCQCKCVLPDC